MLPINLFLFLVTSMYFLWWYSDGKQDEFTSWKIVIFAYSHVHTLFTIYIQDKRHTNCVIASCQFYRAWTEIKITEIASFEQYSLAIKTVLKLLMHKKNGTYSRDRGTKIILDDNDSTVFWNIPFQNQLHSFEWSNCSIEFAFIYGFYDSIMSVISTDICNKLLRR